jgi:ATP-dependent DNA ligase
MIGAVQLPDATALDGELVVQHAAGRLAFERLQNRLARRGVGAVRAAPEWPPTSSRSRREIEQLRGLRFTTRS